jgi:hypothetical protein
MCFKQSTNTFLLIDGRTIISLAAPCFSERKSAASNAAAASSHVPLSAALSL